MPIDYSRYPPDWLSVRRPRILKRAGNCCEECGIGNGSKPWSVPLKISQLDDNGKTVYRVYRFWLTNYSDVKRMMRRANGEIKTVTVVLTIAHLDHDEENHEVEDDRLKALCQCCHTAYDAQEKRRRILSKSEHGTKQ